MVKTKAKRFMLVLTAVFCLVGLVSAKQFIAVKADTTAYTNALIDLQKDSNFDVNNYPLIENDYSLKVIQIAESKAQELFIYVYQPSGRDDIKASTINISLGTGDNLSYKNYVLEYLNSDTVFFKYKVKGFIVAGGDVVRYYDISSIYRPWRDDIDEGTGNDNTIQEIAYPVGQLWSAGTIGDTVLYKMQVKEIITIVDKYVGFLRYSNGFKLYLSSCDSHFVAFSTDKPIEKLYEADIYFTTQKKGITWAVGAGTHEELIGDKQDEYKTLEYTEVVSNSADGILGKKYEWNRIESVPTFIENEELTDDALAQVKEKKWVLRFYESDYTYSSYPGSTYKEITSVEEVTILRLKFETDGVVYNLGVVDNKQSGDDIPDNTNTGCEDIDWKKILFIILCVIAGIIILCFLPTIINIVTFLVKIVVAIVSLPFKFIHWLVTRKKEKKAKRYG